MPARTTTAVADGVTATVAPWGRARSRTVASPSAVSDHPRPAAPGRGGAGAADSASVVTTMLATIVVCTTISGPIEQGQELQAEPGDRRRRCPPTTSGCGAGWRPGRRSRDASVGALIPRRSGHRGAAEQGRRGQGAEHRREGPAHHRAPMAHGEVRRATRTPWTTAAGSAPRGHHARSRRPGSPTTSSTAPASSRASRGHGAMPAAARTSALARPCPAMGR